jgi:hypothetical protein
MFTAIIPSGRIDSPEEFVMSLKGDRVNAVPIAFAVFVLIVALPRPAVLKRVALAILVGVACWFLVWRWLVHYDYTQIRVHGGDPEQVLREAKPQ